MKLTEKTIPQARNYQCNKCKDFLCHKDMYDDNICSDCKDEEDLKGEQGK
ncbi:MAG TPA: hypothetical protein VI911_07400 [Patescibacteria group bacterium]|nr:hypothetical protein [Patescibacteria group bacterium]